MDRMFAPWRRAFIEGSAAAEIPSLTGCIFCDYPLAPGTRPPPTVVDEGGVEHRVTHTTRRAWDEARLVVTTREHGFVILNKYPYNNGHVMIVPRVHTDKLESLDDEAFLSLHLLLKETIAAVRASYAPHGINVGMNMGRSAGAGIDTHCHWHVLPRWHGDVNFMPAIMDTKVVSESLTDTYTRLAAILRRPEDDVGGAP
jgi:ATP adenylyltransferase